MASAPGTLRTTTAQGSRRWSLCDKVVNGGDIVELCCSGGWLTGRFEWPGTTDTPPSFFFSIELDGGKISQQVLEIPEGALLRWPG